jgi:hypothetical protein
MDTPEIKDKIIQKLASIDDATFLKNVLTYIEDLKDSSNLSTKQIDELDKRSANYLAGLEKTTNWWNIKKELQENYGL